MPNFALAVDIGATKAALGIVDEKFQILDKVEVPTGAGTEIWRDIEGASKSLLSKTDGNCIGVGIGSAGPLHLDVGQISPVNIPHWRKFPIVNKFASLVGTPNVVLHGDAMALAHAEYRLGAGQDANNMLGMVVSTGIGGGLILGGKLFTGVTGNASYFGHHTISFEGKECTCGRIGCVETYASGPKMVEHALSIGWQSERSCRVGDCRHRPLASLYFPNQDCRHWRGLRCALGRSTRSAVELGRRHRRRATGVRRKPRSRKPSLLSDRRRDRCTCVFGQSRDLYLGQVWRSCRTSISRGRRPTSRRDLS